MKKILILAFSLFTLGTYAQREVPQSRMEQIYEEAKTPYKSAQCAIAELHVGRMFPMTTVKMPISISSS
jgi:hypothetical protein